MANQSLLHVPVIGLVFKPGPEAVETMQTARTLDPRARIWAVVTDVDVPSVRSEWRDCDDAALLIVHAPSEQAVDAACELLALVPSGPAALLLANFPPQRGFFKSRRFNEDVVRRLQTGHADLQVHVYSPDWIRRPPRLR
jgi:hypothetical protein